jgi:hypothetical protein
MLTHILFLLPQLLHVDTHVFSVDVLSPQPPVGRRPVNFHVVCAKSLSASSEDIDGQEHGQAVTFPYAEHTQAYPYTKKYS